MLLLIVIVTNDPMSAQQSDLYRAGRYWSLETYTIFLTWNPYFRYIYIADFCAWEKLERPFWLFLVLKCYKINKIIFYLDPLTYIVTNA